jgi:molybdenum cofactor biosynthesis enzyme MoaA
MEALVEVNDTCNLGCTFCGISRTGRRSDAVIRERLALFTGAEGDVVTFGGGEPTLDGRLSTWLVETRDRGVTRRQLETNGLRFSDGAYTAEIVGAGLTHARVMIPAADDATWQAVTRLPGRMELAWKGAVQLHQAGVVVSVVVPINRQNVGGVPALLERVVETLGTGVSVSLRPVFFSISPGGSDGPPTAHEKELEGLVADEMLPYEALGRALAEATVLGESLGLKLELDLTGGLPLCTFRREVRALKALSQRTMRYEYDEACGQCAMLERCSGQNPLAKRVFGAYPVRPYDRIPPALVRNESPEPTMIISPGLPSSRYQGGDKAEIRVVMPCNQNCTFCFVNREAPNATLDELERAVDMAVEQGVQAMVFTGGEPTLSRHLPALIARARDAGVPCRGIQTNALKLADPERVRTLVEAGLNHAHVSFHDVDPGRYLAITGFGTPEQAARGAINLAAQGVELSISLVINRVNALHVEATLSFLHAEVPEARIVLSIAREQLGIDRPWDETLIRYEEAGTVVGKVLHYGQKHGITMDMAGVCAMPPCSVPRDVVTAFPSAFLSGHRTALWQDVSAQEEGVTNAVSNAFTEACDRCALKARCPGINRTYLARHGGGEFKPFADEEVHAF